MVATATKPPGFTSLTIPAPVPSDAISVLMGSYFPVFSFGNPGLISISSPTLKVPCVMLPPMTPPFMSLTLAPGLLTSNDLNTCKMVLLDSSLFGVGTEDSIASINASTFNFECAEIGIIGAFAAFVPLTNFTISE